MYVYKIRNKKNGLYSSGGMSPQWTKTGKTWSGLGYVRAHIHQFVNTSMAHRYLDAEVVQVEVVETSAKVSDVTDYMLQVIEKDLPLAGKYTEEKLRATRDIILQHKA